MHLDGRVLFYFLMAWAAAADQIRYAVPEEMEKGSIVGNIARDLGLQTEDLSKRSVRIVSRGKTQHFSFSLTNGYLSISEKIDREKICAHTSPCLLIVELIAQNPLQLYQFEVEIQDINDNAPRFQEEELLLDISEISVPGTLLSLPRASDQDVGVNSIQDYHLMENVHFKTVVSETRDQKEAKLILERALDRENVSVHHLILVATDGGDPVRSGTLQIRVFILDNNDNPPVFSHYVYKVTVDEDVAEGTLLTTVTATDADQGINAEVTYSVGLPPLGLPPKVQIDSQSGDVYLTGTLDFEDTAFYEIKIHAKDNGGLVGESRLMIEVIDRNDNSPTITITSLSTPISEDSKPGTVIAILNVHDRDSQENGRVTCFISENLPFHLEYSFSNYYSLVTVQLLDREEAFEYNISIIAEDHGTPVLTTSEMIRLLISDINDNAPVFDSPSFTAYVMENNPKAVSIFSVKARDSDWDQNAIITYSLMNNFKEDASRFSYLSINSGTGVIYALRSFDYEEFKELKVQVKAHDGGSPPLSNNDTLTIVVVDENDNRPQILFPSPSMDESTGVEFVPRSSDPGYLVTKALQYTSKRLEEHVQLLTKQQNILEARLEDQEGRARRNNIRVVGVPKGAEGPSVDLFLEDLILNKLRPKRLPNFFSVERAHWAPILLPKPL
ncbi:hypothetical protein NDU88_006450 [Pleurodeles waltl]|uniref:Cadherin domain-containing protein n=1 Tax=Pleurodeles waltl TaxID=8319 RepID=A0AAV7PIG6_PLEWA|nr:hypothetical protein NDU88_006450 [Pleurodeles waltl]